MKMSLHALPSNSKLVASQVNFFASAFHVMLNLYLAMFLLVATAVVLVSACALLKVELLPGVRINGSPDHWVAGVVVGLFAAVFSVLFVHYGHGVVDRLFKLSPTQDDSGDR